MERVSYSHVLHKVWPIMLANAAVPALGLVDTAVIGHFGSTTELAALAVASLMFSFIYWGFGFLRMSTTAVIAQAEGAGDNKALMLVVTQSMALALVFALAILLTQKLLLSAGLWLLNPPGAVSDNVGRYFEIRVWGAPATLASYVFSGFFIGRGFSKQLLLIQLVLNGTNACLDILFAGILDLGIEGIAVGTIIAEYVAALLALLLIARHYQWWGFLRRLDYLSFTGGLNALLGQNRDIFIRTLFLLLGFAFFTRTGASFGEEVLAANHILLQLISFSAFFLDGYAYVLESLVGRAFGMRSTIMLDDVIRKTSFLAAGTAILLALTAYFLGPLIVSSLTNKTAIYNLAVQFLPCVAIYISLSVAAFQLDGLYIGAAYSSAMRNCSVISTLCLVAVWYLGLDTFENLGLWLAFIVYVCTRALTLLIFLPQLRARCECGV